MRAASAGCSQTGSSRTSPSRPAGPSREQPVDESQVGSGSSEPAQPSHYLYVPNNAGMYTSLWKKSIHIRMHPLQVFFVGLVHRKMFFFSFPGLNNLNFLLSAGQPPAGLALPPGGVPTLALPYVLLPSAALSHYPLIASGLPQQGSDGHSKLSFSLPTVMSPAHFMVGAAPYGVTAAPEMSRSPVPTPSTPEQSRLYGSAAGTPHSPPRPCQTVSVSTPEPLVRHTHTHTHTQISALKLC